MYKHVLQHLCVAYLHVVHEMKSVLQRLNSTVMYIQSCFILLSGPISTSSFQLLFQLPLRSVFVCEYQKFLFHESLSLWVSNIELPNYKRSLTLKKPEITSTFVTLPSLFPSCLHGPRNFYSSYQNFARRQILTTVNIFVVLSVCSK